MFKSIMNFIRRLMAPKPGRCPKALDYNWSTQDGDGVRKHEATNTGSDPRRDAGRGEASEGRR